MERIEFSWLGHPPWTFTVHRSSFIIHPATEPTELRIWSTRKPFACYSSDYVPMMELVSNRQVERCWCKCMCMCICLCVCLCGYTPIVCAKHFRNHHSTVVATLRVPFGVDVDVDVHSMLMSIRCRCRCRQDVIARAGNAAPLAASLVEGGWLSPMPRLYVLHEVVKATSVRANKTVSLSESNSYS